MFKQFVPERIRNARRRATESLFGAIGTSDRTVDPDFDVHDVNFSAMTEDMNDCGSNLNSTLQNCKAMTTDARDLAIALAKVYEKASDEPWRGASNDLTQTAAAESYRDAWDTINNSYRSTTQAVVIEQALQPLRKAVTHNTPEFEEMKQNRADALLDFDSNRRRLGELEQQKLLAEAKHKHQGDAAIALDSKIEKYNGKKTIAAGIYDKLNEQAKQKAVHSKAEHDELMDAVLITTAVCQCELMKMAANELQKVVDTMPQDRVEDIKARVRELLLAGGTLIPHQESNRASKSKNNSIIGSIGNVFGWGNTEGEPLTPAPASTEEPPAAPSSAPPTSFPSIKAVATPEKVPTNVGTPAAPAPAVAPVAAYPIVTALYDNEIDQDDELPFVAGDKVEVIKTEDGGWWFGRCNGREGLFPVDYVNVEEMPK